MNNSNPKMWEILEVANGFIVRPVNHGCSIQPYSETHVARDAKQLAELIVKLFGK